jgi:hypothetical protein
MRSCCKECNCDDQSHEKEPGVCSCESCECKNKETKKKNEV